MVPSATSVLLGRCNTSPGCIFLSMVTVVKLACDEAETIPANRNAIDKYNLVIVLKFK
jgi:hypothetical protein